MCDIEGSILRGMLAAGKSGLELSEHYPEAKIALESIEDQVGEPISDSEKQIQPTAQLFIDSLIDSVKQRISTANLERESKNL